MSGAPLRVALVGVNAPRYQSLALGYLRAYAEADTRLADVAFVTVDLDTATDPWWIAYRILTLEPRPHVVAFSVLCWNAHHVYEVVRLVKSVHPGACIVLGGPEVGPIAEEVLAEEPSADAVVRGEGEATFADVLAELVGAEAASRPVCDADLTSVAEVTSRHGDAMVSAPDRELIGDLDSIPSPYLTGVMTPLDGATYLETYRGCPHHCAYCFEGKGYGRIRRFSPDRVAAEVDLVASHAGVHSFSFIDPVFNLDGERLEWLAECLAPHAERGIRLHTIEVDVERIGPAEAALLHRAGVASVETGPQSIGASALENCRRTFDRDRFIRGISALGAQGISVECDLILGLPGDTSADVLAGLDVVIGLDPGTIQISTLHVLPGTELWHRADELGVRYDSVAPHEVIATNELGFGELRRLEALGIAATSIYRARLRAEPEASA